MPPYSTVVLAFGFIQNNADPFARSERGVPDVGDGALDVFTDHYYPLAER